MPEDPRRLDGEILDRDAPGGEDARRVATPGWIGRNRRAFELAQTSLAGAMAFLPPPARIPAAAAALAAGAALVAEDARTGQLTREEAATRLASGALGVAVAMVAIGRGPALLVKNAKALGLAHAAMKRLETRQPRG